MWAAEARAKIDIVLDEYGSNGRLISTKTVAAGKIITITHGRDEKYALWGYGGVWDLPEEYVGEIVKIVCQS